MMYILDTNICIYLLNGNEKLETKIRNIGIYSMAITHSVLAELYYGAHYSKRVKDNIKRIDDFRKNLTIIPEDVESSRLFGRIKAELRSKGAPIDDFDVLIASIALSNNCTVVTNNEDHFKRIKGLRVVNWAK